MCVHSSLLVFMYFHEFHLERLSGNPLAAGGLMKINSMFLKMLAR